MPDVSLRQLVLGQRCVMFRRVAIVLVLGLLLSAPVLSQVVTAEVEVQGMSCPFCVAGVEKRLGKVAGVGSVEIELKEGLAILRARDTARDEASINVAEIAEAVRSAGFTPGRIVVEAKGQLRRDQTEKAPHWWLAAGGFDLALLELSGALADRAAELARQEVSIRVRGVLRQPVEERPELDAVELLHETP